MNRGLESDRRAVSTVVGVVLIVGITVVLMGVIGAFVLNAGPGTQPPDASFAITETDNGEFDIRYTGGTDSVDKTNIEVTVEGEPACDGNTEVAWNSASGLFEIGESVDVTGYDDCSNNPEEIDPDDIIRVIWTSDDGTTADILAAHQKQ